MTDWKPIEILTAAGQCITVDLCEYNESDTDAEQSVFVTIDDEQGLGSAVLTGNELAALRVALKKAEIARYEPSVPDDEVFDRYEQ